MNRSRRRVAGNGLLLVALVFLGAGIISAIVHGELAELAGVGRLTTFAAAVTAIAVGMLALAAAVSARLRHRRRERALAADYWRHDHRWDPRRGLDRRGGELVTLLVATAGFAAIAAVAAVLALHHAHPLGYVVAAVFAAVPLFLGIHAGVHAMRWIKFGSAVLELKRAPFFLGERVEARFRAPAKLAGAQAFRVVLRCMVERYGRVLRHGEERQELGTSIAHHEELVVGGPRAPAEPIDLGFALPDRADLSTRLTTSRGGDLARYWEIEISAEMPGLDFAADYRIPVYARGQP
jgi:hypothetical protein